MNVLNHSAHFNVRLNIFLLPIRRAENDPTILSTPRVLIGLCISLFPAALAATARSVTELTKLSLEGFPSFFNWIVANHVRTKQIEQPHGIWSCMVFTKKDVDLQALLDRFHKKHVSHVSSRPLLLSYLLFRMSQSTRALGSQ